MSCFAVFKDAQQMRVFSFDFGSFKDRERAKQKAFDLAHALFDNGKPVIVNEYTGSGRIGSPVLQLQKTQ